MKVNNYPYPCNRLIKPVEKIHKIQIHNEGRKYQQVEYLDKGKKFDKKI